MWIEKPFGTRFVVGMTSTHGHRRARAILSRKRTAGERKIGNKTEAEALHPGELRLLDFPVQKAPLILTPDKSLNAEPFSGAGGGHELGNTEI
jgi:hypothetical protein